MIKQILLCALLMLGLAQASTAASEVSDQDRAIIGRSTNSVWYDAKKGSVHPTRYSRPINVEDRHDSIAGPVNRTTSTWWTSFWRTVGDFFSWIFRGWQILLLISLITFLVIVAFIIFRNGFRFQVLMNKSNEKSSLEKEKAKLLDLPFEVEQSLVGLRAQAERYRAAGDYSKAIIYLFSYALVEMDGARCIHLERGKTNRVYLRELRDHDLLRGFTYQLVQAFEYAFFGKHELSQEAFERIWQQVHSFDSHLKELAAKPNVGLGLLVARVT